VVTPSDSVGDTVQTYEYTVFGQVAAEDPNLLNPYMFTGRRFDFETGLYYYRARYYNPYIGRFLQTDPVGYSDGINWYAYCGNNPLNFVDSSGCHQDDRYHHFHFSMPAETIVDNPGSYSDSDLINMTLYWFEDNYVLSDHPGWEIMYANVGTFHDGSKSLELIFYYMPGPPPPEPLSVPIPGLRTEYVSGFPVLLVDGVGILDRIYDRGIENIMDEWFEYILATPRWNWTFEDWYYDMCRCAITPFRGWRGSKIIKRWKYGGETYSYTEVNYIGFGFGAAHFITAGHINPVFWRVNRYLPQFWNLFKHHHLAGPDQLWYNWGYKRYPGRKFPFPFW
jgi:RHS repeat-associated protein